MTNLPIGPFPPIGVLVLRTLLVCGTIALIPLVAQSQINETEGLWQGTVACGPQQSASGRSPKAFSSPIVVTVSSAALSGKRDNAQVTERFVGSIERSGRVNLEGAGHWKDNPARAWRYRLQGTQSGSRMTLAGPMESPDGQTRIRDCKVELTNPATERRSRVANSKPSPAMVSPVPAAPVTPVGRAPEKVNKDKELADRQAAEKAAADKALAEKAAAERAAAESRKAPIKARSAMDL